MVVLWALGSLAMLGGCNTVKGFGADVESVGRGIQGKKLSPPANPDYAR